jgi:hypothetical protein
VALRGGTGPCLAASSASKPISVRLTIDAQGRIVRVELVTATARRELPAGRPGGPLVRDNGARRRRPAPSEITLRARS